MSDVPRIVRQLQAEGFVRPLELAGCSLWNAARLHVGQQPLGAEIPPIMSTLVRDWWKSRKSVERDVLSSIRMQEAKLVKPKRVFPCHK